MKKVLTAIIGVFLSLGLVIPSSFAKSTVIISHVEGNPMIVRNGQEIPALQGVSCESQDVLKTAPGCVLDIAMNNQLGCRVLASSEVLIADAENIMHLKLNTGNVILNVNKLTEKSEFKVETPTAIAAVRGTQFWGRVEGAQLNNPVTTFAVREGTIEIFALGTQKSFTVNQGEALDIPKDSSITPIIRPALAEELLAMEQASAIKTSA